MIIREGLFLSLHHLKDLSILKLVWGGLLFNDTSSITVSSLIGEPIVLSSNTDTERRW